jgi:hypothetical protein
MKNHPVLTLSVIIGLGLQALLFSGCASGYTRAPGQAPTMVKVSSEKPITEVSITLTPEVKEKLKDSLKFDKDTLLKCIELGLTNRQALNKEKKDGAYVLSVTVTHVRVRNTFNAVMWGAMSGDDSIEGDVIVQDGAGAVIDQFHVNASYALGGFAGGQDSVRMNWLYEAFSKQLVAALIGEAKNG